MKKLWFLLIILLLIRPVYAQNYSLDSYNMQLELFPSGLVREKIIIHMVDVKEDIDHITYSLITEPQDVVVYDESGNLEYEIVKNEEYQLIINKIIRKGGSAQITIEFDTKGLIEQVEKKYIFSFDFIPPTNIENFQIELKLPQGFVLSSLKQSVSPVPIEVYSDGRNIILKWEYQDLNEELAIITVYERGFSEQSPNYLVYGILSLIIIALIALVLFYKREKMDVAMMTLTDEEKMIVNKISDSGEMTQKKLVKLTGYSKSKMSKIIRRLEERGIVEKIPWGNTNILKVSKKLRR